MVLGAALVFAHFRIAQMGDNYWGSFILVDRLFAVCLSLGILSVGFCVGRRVTRILSLSFSGAAEEISVSTMLGVGIIGLVMLCLGLAGQLKPIAVLASFALLVVLAWREAGQLRASLKQAIVSATATRTRSTTLAALFIVLVIVLSLRAMTPPHAPDEAIYHLSVTERFVEEGRVFPVVDNWAGNSPLLIHMVYAVCLLAKADTAAKLLSLLLAVICALSMYAFSARFLTRRAGVVAMFGFFGAGMIAEVAVTSRIDVSLAGMLFLATHAMVTYFETNERGWLYGSAILSGLSLGVKYTAGIYIFLLGIMYLLESLLRRQHQLTTIIKRGAVYSVIVAAVASPWFIKNFVWFGNPVYPFITGEVAEFGAGLRYFNAEDQIKLNDHLDRARGEMPGLVGEREAELAKAAARQVNRHPLRFWEYFTDPDAYNMDEDFHYPNYLFVVSPLMIFVRRSRWLNWLAGFSVLFFLAVTYESWIARILIPIYPALTLISAFTITELAARAGLRAKPEKAGSVVTILSVIALAITLGPTSLRAITQSVSTNDQNFFAGGLSRTAYMMQFYYYPPCAFINSLPESSRVMMIGAQTSYDLRRDYIADVNWDSTEWRRLLIRNRSVEDLNEDLKSRGVTHVWVAYGLFTFVAEMGRENYPNVSGIAPSTGPAYLPQLINWATLDQYSSKFLEAIYNDRFGNIVYRIK